MKKLLVSACITLLMLGLGAWIYQYLNPADTVVDEEIPFFESGRLTQDSEQGLNTSQEEVEDIESFDPIEMSPLQGDFQQGDSSYTIQGQAIVTQQGDQRVVSFVDFSVSAGPDLFVYIVQTEDTSNQGVKDAVTQERFVNIATLKGNVGNQNYEIPEDIDLDGAVISIWCKQFARNFGHAVLN